MQYREANLRVRTDMPPAYFSQNLNVAEIDQPVALAEYAAVRAAIDDFERQLATMPALVEAKLREQLALVRGLDLAGEIERLKARAAEAGVTPSNRTSGPPPDPGRIRRRPALIHRSHDPQAGDAAAPPG